MSKKSAISGVFVVLGFVALAGKAYYDKEQQPQVEQEQLEDIPVEALNGEFRCEYYKAKTQVVEGIAGYEVTEGTRGWNWVFHMHDETSIFYTQTAGQFCYVVHVGED